MKLAWPALSVAWPSFVLPFSKVKVIQLGEVAPAVDGAITAVNVTVCPYTARFAEEVNVDTGSALFTVWLKVRDVDLLKFPSPEVAGGDRLGAGRQRGECQGRSATRDRCSGIRCGAGFEGNRACGQAAAGRDRRDCCCEGDALAVAGGVLRRGYRDCRRRLGYGLDYGRRCTRREYGIAAIDGGEGMPGYRQRGSGEGSLTGGEESPSPRLWSRP